MCIFNGGGGIFHRAIYPFLKLVLHIQQVRYNTLISEKVQIGKGFFITHLGGIVINSAAIIGNNVNISNGVTIGNHSRGDREGVPIIGNEVFIGPGAVIFGNIKIGNRVAIGANAVVTKDIPDDAVVVGNPARIISYKGSSGYILNKQ